MIESGLTTILESSIFFEETAPEVVILTVSEGLTPSPTFKVNYNLCIEKGALILYRHELQTLRNSTTDVHDELGVFLSAIDKVNAKNPIVSIVDYKKGVRLPMLSKFCKDISRNTGHAPIVRSNRMW